MKVNTAIFTKRRFLRGLVRWIIAAFFAAQVVIAIPRSQDAIAPLLIAPNLTYTDKMYIQWGDLFVLLDFIRRQTPPDAIILMKDDQRPQFDQYFLFPRRVIYGDANALRDNPQVQYLLIARDYPQFPVSGTRIMLDDTHGLYRLQR